MAENKKLTRFNWPIVGHKNIVELLGRSIANNKLVQAYLFYGPEHIGKTAVVKELVASLICEENGLESRLPCRNCVACEQFAKNIYPDIFWIEKEADKKNISIEQTRELQGRLAKTSFLNSYKIAIINRAEDLSEEAADSLLKTLEEPTPKSIIILISSKLTSLPATVVSRCQSLRFSPVAQDEIFHHLIKLGASRQLADNLAHLANGRVGLAIDYFQNQELFDAHQTKVKGFLKLIEADLVTRFKLVSDLVPTKGSSVENLPTIFDLLEVWSSVLRDLILIKNNSFKFGSNIFIEEELSPLARKFAASRLIKLLNKIKEVKALLALNVNQRLALENFALEFS